MDSPDNPRLSKLALGRAIVAAVQSVPGVAGMSAGRYGEVATSGAGDKVPGVVITLRGNAMTIEVHVCAEYGESLVFAELAAQVRQSIRQTLESSSAAPTSLSRIDVAFDDLYVALQQG